MNFRKTAKNVNFNRPPWLSARESRESGWKSVSSAGGFLTAVAFSKAKKFLIQRPLPPPRRSVWIMATRERPSSVLIEHSFYNSPYDRLFPPCSPSFSLPRPRGARENEIPAKFLRFQMFLHPNPGRSTNHTIVGLPLYPKDPARSSAILAV